MTESNIVAATFDAVRDATAAVDWFRNQGTDPEAIGISALPPGERPRAPRPGDNHRTGLAWLVTIDLKRAPVSRRIAIETMKREGGKITNRALPDA
jgi:hypothetical protein